MRPPELDLSSVYAKLEWATSHFKAVDAEIDAWLHSGENLIIYERNEDFTQHYLRAHLPGPKPDFRRWSLMIGDCVTNLRDALDHAVFAIAQLPTSRSPDKRDKACFLMTSRPEDFKNWSKTKLASVPDSVKDVILSFQPYNRPHPILPPLLSILSELANRNKHRLLNVVMTSPGIAEVNFISGDGISQPATVNLITTDIQHDTVMLIFEIEKPDPSVYLESANATLHVAIQHTPRDGDKEFGADRTSYSRLILVLMDEVALALDAMVSALQFAA